MNYKYNILSLKNIPGLKKNVLKILIYTFFVFLFIGIYSNIIKNIIFNLIEKTRDKPILFKGKNTFGEKLYRFKYIIKKIKFLKNRGLKIRTFKI